MSVNQINQNFSLIKIEEKEGKQVVSARELHQFLEVKTLFKDWINRMLDYGFEEGLDFSSFLSKSKGGRPSKEYALTLDCAKQIAMVQRSEKGKQARQYFIECEKKLKELANKPKELSRLGILKMALDSEKENEKLRIENNKLKPKAELMDCVMDCGEMIDIGQSAKILELGYGRNTLFKKLRECGIFFKDKNEPKQKHIDAKRFVLKQQFIERNNHEGFTITKVLAYLHEKLKGETSLSLFTK